MSPSDDPSRAPDSVSLHWQGQPYSIKRHGTTIDNCDSEPVQTPGCIQSYGALLVVRPSDLLISQISENSAVWFGRPPAALLGQSLFVAIGAQHEARVREHLRPGATEQPVYVLTTDATDAVPALDVTVHSSDGLLVFELEPSANPATAAEPDYFLMLRTSVDRLQSSRSLRDFSQAVTREVQAMTGLDRVMVYRFHEDAHGEVFAESARADLPPWLGLHYPAEDIPQPARDIFLKLWIRPVPDVGAELCELVPLANPDSGKPLNMTHCALRGPSIMYSEYLQNMGVKACLTLPIRRDGVLWGLIACHHYSAPRALSYQMRAACELFAQIVSLQLKSAEERELLEYRLKLARVHQSLVTQAAQRQSFEALTDGSPALPDAIAATGAAILHGRVWWTVGDTPPRTELDALAAWLRERPELYSSGAYATDCLSRAYGRAEAFSAIGSGLLAVPLASPRAGFLLWFRPETIHTIDWAGNPHDKPAVAGPNGARLTPRKSFELFVESVRRRSLPWQSVELEAARRLRSLLLEIVVSQAERLGEVNADLARSNDDLDAFAYVASHDLKEPLRGIHKYAHQLRDDAAFANDEQRRKLDGLVRLTLRMDSLLDSLLYFSRVGRATLELATVDLGSVLDEALEMIESRRADYGAEVIVARPLPTIRCDRVRVRQILVNLLSNAIKYNDKPQRRIEIGYLEPDEPGPRGEAPAAVVESTVYFVRDDGIGIDSRHTLRIFEMFSRLHGREQYGGGTGAGLTIVKKLVERHGGQVWVQSTLGEGATFFFTLEGQAQ